MASNQVVEQTRQVLETLYTDRCTIKTSEAYRKRNGATAHRWKVLAEDEPCRISYSLAIHRNQTVQQEPQAVANKTVYLFARPDLDIPEGSRVTVTRQGETKDYNRSGPPNVYSTHRLWQLRLEGGV